VQRLTRFCIVDVADALQQDCIPVVEAMLHGQAHLVNGVDALTNPLRTDGMGRAQRDQRSCKPAPS